MVDELPETSEKPKKMKKKSRLTRTQKILLAAIIVLSLVLVGTLAYWSLFQRPELPETEGDISVVEDLGVGLQPRVSGERKSDDFYTILVLGRDTGGGGNTDTMLLASYDVTNQKLTVMSIPRDTMVNVSWDIKKINSVYNYYGGNEKGITALNKEISQLVGFVPDYQVVVEWDAVGKLVDAIGGVNFDVPRNMDYDDPAQDLSIHITKGYQKLDGEQAMGVIRWRHNNNMKYGYADGDLGRIKTQQAFLKAVIEQLLQMKNVTKINEFAKIFEENVKTDLSISNLFWFGKSAILGGLTMDNVNFVTMPNKNVSCWSRTYHNYQSYVVPQAEELLDLVNTSLSPFVEPSTLGELDIMSVNSDGSVSSTTGTVEDSKAAKKPTIPSKVDKTPVDNSGTGEVDPSAGAETGETTGETGETTAGENGTTGETTGGTTGETTGETGAATGETDTTGETTGGTSGETAGGTTDGTSTGDTPDGTTGETTANTTDGTAGGTTDGDIGGTTTGATA